MNQQKTEELSYLLDENVSYIKQKFGKIIDLKEKDFEIGVGGQKGKVLFIEGLVDGQVLQQLILKPLAERDAIAEYRGVKEIDLHFTPISQLTYETEIETICDKLMDSNVLLFLENCNEAIAFEIRNIVTRSVGEPMTEKVIYGPNESFVENLKMNTIMIRHRIRTTELQMEALQVGSITKTNVQLMYLEGRADKEIVDKVRTKLNEIDIDAVFDIHDIFSLVNKAHKYSIFTTCHKTERPDVVASLLTEGRVVIMVEGSRMAIAVPAFFFEFFQSSEDYYSNYAIGSFLRVLRFLCFFVAILSPGIFIAFVSFHQDMIPTVLLTSLISQNSATPFPTLLQLILLELTFEVIREASTRLPNALGSAVSLVGALIIGQTAVEAGLVTAGVIIIVAITGLCSFVFQIYAFTYSLRLLRFAFILAGATLGLFGITSGFLFLIGYLCYLTSIGVPFMGGISPFVKKAQGDIFIHLPLKNHQRRGEDIQQIIETVKGSGKR